MAKKPSTKLTIVPKAPVISTGLANEALLAAELPVNGLAIVDEASPMADHSFFGCGGHIVRVHWTREPKPNQIAQVARIIGENCQPESQVKVIS